MPWWRLRRDGAGRQEPERRPPVGAEPDAPVVREAERRRLRRLLQRRDDLAYDIAHAEQAFLPENRWVDRARELDAAIAEAEADLAALQPSPHEPGPMLPETPIRVVEVDAGDQASVVLAVDDVRLGYREEPDWAERGHQLAPPRLSRVRGDVDVLLPEGRDAADRADLAEHLRHSFAVVAEDTLAAARDGQPLPQMTLADLARPCPVCGGRLDPKGRCPTCMALDWRRQALRDAVDRLLAERDATLADLARTRDRLPVVRRQLAEVEADIAQLQAKGVEPA